jgi:RNA polymerase sigma-70 factor (ECF subfamily)
VAAPEGPEVGASGSAPPAVRRVDGGLAAFEELYDDHAQFVYRTLVALGVPLEHADDALQETFLVVHRRLHEFEGRSAVRTWLFAIARRVARSTRRRAALRMLRGSSVTELEHVADRGSRTPFDQMAHAEDVKLLYRALSSLDEKRRSIFILVELEQMTLAQAAEALSLNPKTAHYQLRTARDRVQRALLRYAAAEKVSP